MSRHTPPRVHITNFSSPLREEFEVERAAEVAAAAPELLDALRGVLDGGTECPRRVGLESPAFCDCWPCTARRLCARLP